MVYQYHHDVEAAPGPEQIAEALSELSDCRDSTPSISALRTLESAGISPTIEVGNSIIKSWNIEEGNPGHGEMRSDTHVSSWHVVWDTLRNECEDCSSTWREHQFDSYHHISGSYETKCQICGNVFESEDWG